MSRDGVNYEDTKIGEVSWGWNSSFGSPSNKLYDNIMRPQA